MHEALRRKEREVFARIRKAVRAIRTEIAARRIERAGGIPVVVEGTDGAPYDVFALAPIDGAGNNGE